MLKWVYNLQKIIVYNNRVYSSLYTTDVDLYYSMDAKSGRLPL